MSAERVKLTEKELHMLRLVGSQATIRSGLKGHLVGDGWRVLDRIVAMGLVRSLGFGAHQITDAGRHALAGDRS